MTDSIDQILIKITPPTGVFLLTLNFSPLYSPKALCFSGLRAS